MTPVMTCMICRPGALLSDPRAKHFEKRGRRKQPATAVGTNTDKCRMTRAQGRQGRVFTCTELRGCWRPWGAGGRRAPCRCVRSGRGIDFDPSSMNVPWRVRGCAFPVSERVWHVLRSRAHMCPGGGTWSEDSPLL